MNYFSYPFYIFFGILPSFIWLIFYLKRDVHPEPKSMILKIFFYGMLITIPAIFLEIAILWAIERLNFSPFNIFILNIFLGVALIEEFLKFLVVKEKVLNHPEFDEPVDAMIYMIVAGLGFAAGENIIILISAGNRILASEFLFSLKSVFFGKMFEISLLRFLGATFLHALASAVVGFFIGLSFFDNPEGIPSGSYGARKKRWKLISLGLILAILLHGLYNFSIIEIEGSLKLIIPVIILICSAIFVSFGFKKLQKLKSVCKIT